MKGTMVKVSRKFHSDSAHGLCLSHVWFFSDKDLFGRSDIQGLIPQLSIVEPHLLTNLTNHSSPQVLRNHKDGRYEVYTSGGFGLVPGKILAYIQYEPDYIS